MGPDPSAWHWEQVVGQPAAADILRGAVAHDEVAHAWLFVGASGVGQREAARALAAELNCPMADDHGGACGTCSTCTRIMAGRHPAVRDLEPEGAFHVVEAVREDWIPTATRTLVEGRRRVLRVAAADRMNEATQNAFLKILEEPPASVVWVLDAEDENALLETIVSRCRRVDFVPWTPDALVERAATLGVEEERRATLARASMGSPERLADLADPEVADARRTHLGIVGRLAGEGPGIAVPLAKELDRWARGRTKVRKAANEDELDRLEEAFGGEWPPGVKGRLTKRFERLEREERQRALRLLLDDLASYLRDLMVVGSGGAAEAAVNADHADLLRRDVGRVPAPVALEGLEAVIECQDALERFGQPELHLERLLLRLGVALYRVEA